MDDIDRIKEAVTVPQLWQLLGYGPEPKLTVHHSPFRDDSNSDIGREKYGTSMERTDLTTAQWLQHMKEELLDGAIYCERVKRDLVE